MYLLGTVCNKRTLKGILQTYLSSIRYTPLQTESILKSFKILINGYNEMFGYKLYIPYCKFVFAYLTHFY